jgi:hypothetical protein
MEYLRKKFGKSVIANAPYTKNLLQNVVTQVVYANENRVMLTIVNLGDYDVFIGFDDKVSSTNGILLIHNGGAINLLVDEDGSLVFMPVYAICPLGTSTLYILEEVMV